MRKFAIFIALLLAIIGTGFAQNANRKGFFIEAGVGGMIGENPRTEVLLIDDVLQYRFAAGPALDFGLGGRFRISSHWSYEIKLEYIAPFSNMGNAFTLRALPLGVRYISNELTRNISLYSHINLGYALCAISGHYFDNLQHYNKLNAFESGGDVGNGISLSIGLGVNITTHLYLEGFCNPQCLYQCFGINGDGTIFGGMAGVMIGYRF